LQFTCENKNIVQIPDIDEGVGNGSRSYNNEAVSGICNGPLDFLHDFGTSRFWVIAFQPMEVLQSLRDGKGPKLSFSGEKLLISYK
jgi:hypothetical protein